MARPGRGDEGRGRTSDGTHRGPTSALGAAGPGPRPGRRARRLDRHVCGVAGVVAGVRPDADGLLLRPWWRDGPRARCRPAARRARLWGSVRGRPGPGHLVGLVPGGPAGRSEGQGMTA